MTKGKTLVEVFTEETTTEDMDGEDFASAFQSQVETTAERKEHDERFRARLLDALRRRIDK